MINGYYYGFDISAMQGAQSEATFAAKKAAGLDFIIHRASIGNDGFDTVFHTNIANAQAAGIKVAAYNFLYPIPKLNPVQQAQTHFAALEKWNPILTAADFEWPTQPQWAKWGCSPSQIAEWTLAYLQAYTQLSGTKPWVYTFPDFMRTLNHPGFLADYKLWIASYAATPLIPQPWNDWVCWQFNDGPTDSIGGSRVDVDYCKDLSVFDVAPVAQPMPNPAPAPTPDPVPAPPVPQVIDPAPPPAPITPIQSTTNVITSIFSSMKNYVPVVSNFILYIVKKIFSIK